MGIGAIVQIILERRLQPIVTTSAALAELAARLATQPRIGLDTEFLRERTYRARAVPVQVSLRRATRCASIRWRSPIWRRWRRVLGRRERHQGHARLAAGSRGAAAGGRPGAPGVRYADRRGADRPAGADRLRASWCAGCSARSCQSHTRTDWSRRPLSPEQIEYALDDVRYLLPLQAARGAARASRTAAMARRGAGGARRCGGI